MPDAHIWIRKEDEKKWKAIGDKPRWLHEHLNSQQRSMLRGMTDHQLWVIAAKLVGADDEDHEDDELIEPMFQRLRELQ